MRQLLIEAARRRNASKRGGGADWTVTLDDTVQEKPAYGRNLIALHGALDSLARMNPGSATMVELRFLGGLDVKETAELLDVSEATILRDWRGEGMAGTRAAANKLTRVGTEISSSQ